MADYINELIFGGIKLLVGEHASKRCIAELTAMNKKKPLIVSDKGIEKSGILSDFLTGFTEAGINFCTFCEVDPDPTEEMVLSGLKVLKENACDSVIGIGGGSPMDVAKCVRILAVNEGSIFEYDNSKKDARKFLNRGLFLVLIPTTAGTGSEATPYAIITNRQENRKATITSNYNLPDIALLDPLLTISLPKAITAATGMDALSHAIGAYTSGRVINTKGDTTISDTLSLKAIQMVAENLRSVCEEGNNHEARKKMLVASFMAAAATPAGGDACHGLGHALGAIYHVPHGMACAVCMPEVLAYNVCVCPERMKNIAVAFGEDLTGLSEMEAAAKASEAARSLLTDVGVPSLKDMVGDFEKKELLVKTALVEKCSKINPRKLSYEAITEIFEKAYTRGEKTNE